MTSQEHNTDVNPVWQSVTGSIIQNQTQREALKAKHNALTAQINTLQGNLSGVEGSTVAFNSLRQKVTDLDNNYQLYTQKRDESRMADAMNANRLLNVAVAQNPTYSVLAYSPKPVLDTVLGTFTAIFFASFLVFFAEMGRNTFASSTEATAVLHLPALAEVPLIGGRKRADKHAEFAPYFVGMGGPKAASAARGQVNPAIIRYRKESEA
jgi:hypothetical protein